MSRPYDSNEANDLLVRINNSYSLAQNIDVEPYRSSYGSLCNKTKELLDSGKFTSYLDSPSNIVSEIGDISSYLDNSIKLISSIDSGELSQEDITGIKDSMNNIMDSFYKEKYGDMYFNLDGVPYILLSQTGHSSGNTEDTKEPLNSPLYTDFFLFTDGDKGSGKGTSLAGASCSFCSTLNCIIADKGYEYVMEKTGAYQYFDDYYKKTGSMNSASLAAINKAFSVDWLNACDPSVDYNSLSDSAKIMRDKYVTSTDYNADKVNYWKELFTNGTAYNAFKGKGTSIPSGKLFTNNSNKGRGIDTFVDSYFSGVISSDTSQFGSGYSSKKANNVVKDVLTSYGIEYNDDTTFEKLVENGTVKMVIRMPKNSSSSARYKSGSGHYIASVGVDSSGDLNFSILDSAVDIDDRQAKSNTKNNRIGYVPVKFFETSKKGPRGAIYIFDEEKLDELKTTRKVSANNGYQSLL